MKTKSLFHRIKFRKSYFLGLATGLLFAILVLKLVPLFIVKTQTLSFSIPFVKKLPTPTPDPAKQLEEITKAVFPDKVSLSVSYGNIIMKMVQYGAIDKDKFFKLYEGRGGLTEAEKKLFENSSDEPIIVNQQNANLILNLLWPLGIANKTNVLAEGPMGTQYKNEVGNFASTGGWTLGKESGGNLFNKYPILPLSSDEEKIVTEIAQNIYRPCCGNSTYFPDCNHGAAMLGFIEIAVKQGMSREEIYKKALALNAYWFPQTYAELGIYFKQKKNIPWDKVDPKLVLGIDYSSGQGYRVINKELQTERLLPKVEGGGGCGV
ncbi:hypothetical protein HY338_03290 [Candidatus Gottesmanbacteria bacterium]|nr:hypothetical protein [Candidatus Gottesmanbacteria bacterium]